MYAPGMPLAHAPRRVRERTHALHVARAGVQPKHRLRIRRVASCKSQGTCAHTRARARTPRTQRHEQCCNVGQILLVVAILTGMTEG